MVEVWEAVSEVWAALTEAREPWVEVAAVWAATVEVWGPWPRSGTGHGAVRVSSLAISSSPVRSTSSGNEFLVLGSSSKMRRKMRMPSCWWLTRDSRAQSDWKHGPRGSRASAVQCNAGARNRTRLMMFLRSSRVSRNFFFQQILLGSFENQHSRYFIARFQ